MLDQTQHSLPVSATNASKHAHTGKEGHSPKSVNNTEANSHIQGGSNMTGTDLYVNKPHCAAAVRP